MKRADFHSPRSGGATRRQFLGALATAATASAFLMDSSASAASPKPPRGLIDVNVNLSRWPLRRLPEDDPEKLVRKLRAHGVTQAWVGSFDGLLERDLRAVNNRLAASCRQHGRGLLEPFGSINPAQADWEEDLRRCDEVHRMPGIRLHPNYHGYKLDHPRFAQLLTLAAQRKMIVQIALRMEDERMMHPLWRVEPVDTKPLGQLVRQTPGLKVCLINALGTLHGASLQALLEAGDVNVEISMLEGVGGVRALLETISDSRLLFGSHAPLFYFESAELKLLESPLSPEQSSLIRSGNAKRLSARGV